MTQQIQSIPHPSYTTVQRDALTSSGYFSIGFKITNIALHVPTDDRGSKNIYNS